VGHCFNGVIHDQNYQKMLHSKYHLRPITHRLGYTFISKNWAKYHFKIKKQNKFNNDLLLDKERGRVATTTLQ